MVKNIYFRPGDIVFIREIWQGKVWRASPYYVVQDGSDLIALYTPMNAITKYPRALNGERVKPLNRVKSEWDLTDEELSQFSVLRLAIPGSAYSVLVLRAPDGKHLVWYINLEDPLRHTAGGFNYLDQFLDVIVEADLSGWHWKDEDEFDEAIALGLISKKRAAAMRAEGEEVAAWIQSSKSPFNTWADWKPDPVWKVPVLPEGWDKT